MAGLTKDDIKGAVRDAVRQEFMNVGWYDDEVQEIRKDFTFLRITRKRCTNIRNKVAITIAGMATTLGMGALGAGILQIINKNGG